MIYMELFVDKFAIVHSNRRTLSKKKNKTATEGLNCSRGNGLLIVFVSFRIFACLIRRFTGVTVNSSVY